MGRRSDGQRLASIFERAVIEMSSIDSIEAGANYGAEVEGRKIFSKFAKTLIKEIKTQKHQVRPKEVDDYT